MIGARRDYWASVANARGYLGADALRGDPSAEPSVLRFRVAVRAAMKRGYDMVACLVRKGAGALAWACGTLMRSFDRDI